MVMAMDYHEGTPSEYQAPLFHSGDENVSRLLNLGHFNENLTMKTGFHRYAEIQLSAKSETLTIRSVSVGMLLPLDLEQPVQAHRQINNGDPSPSPIDRYAQRAGTGASHFRQSSSLSEIEGANTQPEAMRQIAGMVGLISFRDDNNR